MVSSIQMYVPQEFKITEDALTQMVTQINEPEDITWKTLLMADYVYHHRDQDYDGGLSFLDRLSKKIGFRHRDEWNIEEFKDWVRNHQNPQNAFIRIIDEMLEDSDDIDYYGL